MGDQILVRYSEPGGLARSSPVSSPGSEVGITRGTVASASEEMSIAPPEVQPARVPMKVVSKDPVESGTTSGKPPVLSKSYKKRPVALASGDKVAAEKRTKTSAEDDRPGKKAATTGGQAKTAKPSKAVVPVRSAGPIFNLATSGSESDDSGDD